MDTEVLKPRYEAQINEYLSDVLATFQQAGIPAEPGSDGDCWDGDTRWSILIENDADSQETGAELTIQIIGSDNGWDAPERDGLNVMVDLTEYGGRMLGEICPANFTDEVWVNPENLPELDRRVEDVLSVPARQWLAAYIG